MQNNNQKEIIFLKDLGTQFPNENSKRKRRYGLYRCHCGNEFKRLIDSIKSGNTESCGCMRITHHLSNHRLYGTWHDMIRRCNNPKRKEYRHYGGRGIKVCSEWLDINNFINDMYPTFKEGLELDRIDVNGNYCKDNCRWASRSIQMQNTRKLRNTNKSGYRGVIFKKALNKWNAYITVNYKRIHLGYFNEIMDAAKAYDKYIIDNNLEHTRNL